MILLTGYIMCRLPNDSIEVRELGILLRDRSGGDRRFVVEERFKESTPQHFEITSAVLENMIMNSQFEMNRVMIRFSNKHVVVKASLFFKEGEQYDLSGFPRCLVPDGESTASR
jgi:hypothetical protein